MDNFKNFSITKERQQNVVGGKPAQFMTEQELATDNDVRDFAFVDNHGPAVNRFTEDQNKVEIKLKGKITIVDLSTGTLTSQDM